MTSYNPVNKAVYADYSQDLQKLEVLFLDFKREHQVAIKFDASKLKMEDITKMQEAMIDE